MTMNELISVFKPKTLNENDEGILDLLYDDYAEFHGWDNPQSKEYYSALRALIKDRTPDEQEQFMDLINTLCDAHERTAFLDGVRTGVRLLCELMV